MASNVAKLPRGAEAGTVQWFNECVERGKRGVFSETVTVTPGLASVILERNPENRNVRPAKVAQFVSDIRAGRWAFNGEPVIIAKTGELNDGQHRLGAVIDANKPIPFLFVFGVERDTRTTVDQGSARTAADYLGMKGASNATAAAAIARIVIAYERSGGQDIAQTRFVTNAEVLARATSDPGIAEAAHYAMCKRTHTRTFCAPSPIGAALYILKQEHASDAEAFMDQVCVGEGLRKADPAFAVRERLWTTTRHASQKLEVIFRGWNAYRSGRPLHLVKVFGNLPALV